MITYKEFVTYVRGGAGVVLGVDAIVIAALRNPIAGGVGFAIEIVYMKFTHDAIMKELRGTNVEYDGGIKRKKKGKADSSKMPE